MAFNSIPKNLSEMRAVAGSSIDEKYRGELSSSIVKLKKHMGWKIP